MFKKSLSPVKRECIWTAISSQLPYPMLQGVSSTCDSVGTVLLLNRLEVLCHVPQTLYIMKVPIVRYRFDFASGPSVTRGSALDWSLRPNVGNSFISSRSVKMTLSIQVSL
jgi:hypothetical protein